MATTFRGHEIYMRSGKTYYCDNDESTVGTWKDRPCGHCGMHNTAKDHDACIANLEGGVMNACCGHGERKRAYIQFKDGKRIDGEDVFNWLKRSAKKILKKENP